MKNQRISVASGLCRPLYIILLLAALLSTSGCGKDRKKPTKGASAEPNPATSTASEPTTNTTEQSPKAGAVTPPTGALGMLPKDVNRWFELPNPLGSATNLGLLDSGNGVLDQMLSEDGKEIQKDLGIDLSSEAALRATGIALDRPMGVSWIETHDILEDLNAALPYVDAIAVYVHLKSPEMFENTLKTLSENTEYTLQTESVDGKGVIHRLDKFICIAVRGDVAMGFFQDPGETASTAGKPRKLLHPCKDALGRTEAESLAGVAAAKNALQSAGDIRGYDHGELVGNTLHPILWMFLHSQDMRKPDLEQIKEVFALTVPETAHAQHQVSIGKNNITGSSVSVTTGERLMPNLFANAKPPAWRGYFAQKPLLSMEINLNIDALHAWWDSVNSVLKLGPSPAIDMLKKSGATGRLAIYGNADVTQLKVGAKDSIHLYVLGEVDQPDFVQKQLASLQPPVSAQEGSTWVFPGPADRKIWVHLSKKTLLLTTDQSFISRTNQAPGKATWSLPADADGASLLTQLDLGALALAAAVWNEEPITAPKVEASWSKDPEVAKLVKELQVLRDKEAEQASEWRKAERSAVSDFWDRLGTSSVSVRRTKTGVDVNANWQCAGTWSQTIKQSTEHAEKMRKDSLDYRKRWHQGSLKREALMHEIQRRSKL